MSYDDEYALMRARVYEERGVIPWPVIAITAPPPTPGAGVPGAVTAQEIVTLNSGAWAAWWHPSGDVREQVTGLVLRERAWYGARGVEPPFHPWQRLVP